MAKNENEQVLKITVNYKDAVKGIIAYKNQIEDLKKKEKELKEQLKKTDPSSDEYQKLNEQLVETKANMGALKDEVRTLERFTRNQIKQEKEQKGSLRALRAELSNLTAQYDSLSKEERENVDTGGKLKDSINEVTAELKEAEEGTQRYYRNVGNYEEAIKEALGLNNEFANSLLEMASNSGNAGGMFAQIEVKAKAFGNTLLGFMSNPVFLALAGIAGAGVAFKWFYDYNKGLVEATRLTQQFTGLSGNELKEYRNEVQSLADVYNKDFREVLQSTNAVARQFEISQSDALSVVRDGFIAGADASGEYLDILREYPAYFREAGISADQFVAIITNATQQGIFSDKGIDAIKEANTRIREMTTATAAAFEGIGMSSEKVQEELQDGTKTTFDIIQEVADRLQELPESSAAAGAALADIFGEAGEDAGLRYIKTLGDISTNLDEVKAKSGELGELQEQLLESQTNLENALSGLFDMTGGTFEEMTTKAKIFINDGIIGIINGIENMIESVRMLYNQSASLRFIAQGIITTFKTAFDLISTLAKTTAEQLSALNDMIKGLFTFDFDAIEDGFKRLNKAVVENTKGIIQELKQNFSEFSQEFMNGSWGTSDDSSTETPSNGQKVSQPTNAVKVPSWNLSTTSQAVKAKQKELEEVRKMEDELLKLEKDSRKKQTQMIEYEYNRQIEDLRTRLSTETDLTSKAREAINSQIESLEKQKQDALQKLSDEELQKEIENRQKLIEAQLASVEEGSRQEYDLKMKQLQAQRDAELADKELTEKMKAAIEAKYRKQQQGLTDQFNSDVRKKQQDEMRMRMENEILELQNSGDDELDVLRKQVEQKKEIYDSINRENYNSDLEYQNAKLRAQQDYNDAMQELYDRRIQIGEDNAKKQVEIERKKRDAIAQITDSLVGLLELAGENNRAAAVAAKTLAIAEIAIAQGVAIANAVKTATKSSATWIDMLAAIATVISSVTAVMSTARKSIKSAKFAQGGLVTGPGTGTSDSIPARLSNGESVMTAKATEMFAPILSSFNMMGGGVPINVTQTSSQTLGEDMLARAVAKGVKEIRPVVSVEEITSVANRVEVLENLGNV